MRLRGLSTAFHDGFVDAINRSDVTWQTHLNRLLPQCLGTSQQRVSREPR